MPHRPVKRAPDNITFAEIEKIASDETACRALFERLRFSDGLRCYACGASEASGHRFTRHRSRPGLFTCCECRRQFTLTSGTAMHKTRLPLGQWLRAIWLVAASSKGISARKLSEMLGVSGASRLLSLEAVHWTASPHFMRLVDQPTRSPGTSAIASVR